MSDLHERLRAAINQRLELAGTALRHIHITDVWELPGDPRANAAFIVANDPATVERHCLADLRRLERHAPRNLVGPKGYEEMAALLALGPFCSHDQFAGVLLNATPWPCDEIAWTAEAYGIAIEVPDGD